MNKIRKIILCSFTLYALIMTTACPSQTSLQKAKDSSAKLATFANEGVNITRDLFREKIISLDQKDHIAEGFILLARSGIAFDSAVVKLQQTYGDKPPRSEIEKLFAVFDAEVVAKFVAVLATLKVVGKDSKIVEIISFLQTAILTIARAFNREKQIKLQIEAV
jgi:hypothetical protein